MRQRILTTLFALLTICQISFSQTRTCHSHHYLEEQKANDPQRAAQLEDIENHLQKFIAEQANSPEMNTVYSIPVVVHVIYEGAAQNISDAQIQSQMQVLNDDFRRLNSDADNTWPQAADSEIEFCLATVDPNGNPTTGITRTSTTSAPFGTNDNMKFTNQGGQNIWDRNQYLNMWVCEIGGGILGYAQFPGGPAATDGVVMDYRYFGTIGTATAPFDLGRTTTHEVGHWLNLYHIWGDGNCNQDDEVADTPSSDAANYGCATGHTSCGSVDMVQNYMDYSDDACMNLFTAGQKTRMRGLFAAGGARAALLNSAACGSTPPPSCGTPSGLASSNLANSSATVSWSAVTDANDYDLDYRQNGGSWSTQTVSGTSTNLTGLSTCTNYDVRVRANCASGASANSSNVSFQTTGCTAPCDTPTGLATSNIADNTANANWNAVSGAASYQVQIRPNGGSWTTTTANGTSTSFSNLATCTNYDVRIRANCASNNSAYSSISSFQTTGCSSGCNDNELTLTIVADDYGSETTWEVTENGAVLYSGGPYANNSTNVIDLCLTDGCYEFTINDSYGDGICCAWGNGSYEISAGGSTLISGGQFGFTETQSFDAGAGCGGGGGGGCTDVVIDFNNFDSGWGIWNDGGSDCRRSTRDAAWAYSGNRCVRLRDNTNTSTMTTDNLDLSNADEITVDFTYIARSMDNSNEDFWLQISTNGGSSYSTVEEWNKGDEFENNIREFDAVTVSGPFSANTKIRFRADASGNSDWVYIDDVEISACVTGGNRTFLTEPVVENDDLDIDLENELDDVELTLYPNPVSDNLTIEYVTNEKATIMVTDFTGKVMQSMQLQAGENQTKLNVSQFTSGYYLIHLVSGQERVSEKFVVVR